MKVQCVTCKNFTLQPREAEEGNERLREFDRDYAAIGWGRCAFWSGLSYYWLPSDTWRQCDRHELLDQELIDARRTWIATKRPLQ
jgi:hypothetical protein